MSEVQSVPSSEPEFDVGYASGVFDMFHVGHLRLLQRARRHCRHLVVGIATDEYVERLKGRRPVVPCSERVDILAALAIVDEVVLDHHEDKTEAWSRRHFDVIFKGNDWQGTARGCQLELAMASVGAEVVYFPYTPTTSSSLLRSHLAAAPSEIVP